MSGQCINLLILIHFVNTSTVLCLSLHSLGIIIPVEPYEPAEISEGKLHKIWERNLLIELLKVQPQQLATTKNHKHNKKAKPNKPQSQVTAHEEQTTNAEKQQQEQ